MSKAYQIEMTETAWKKKSDRHLPGDGHFCLLQKQHLLHLRKIFRLKLIKINSGWDNSA